MLSLKRIIHNDSCEINKKAKTEYFRLLSRIQLSLSGSKYEMKKIRGKTLQWEIHIHLDRAEWKTGYSLRASVIKGNVSFI